MITTDDIDTVEQALVRYGALVREAATRYLPVDGPGTPYLDDLVRDYPARGGKSLRPALLLAACQAFGGSVDDALGAAVSVELLHNSFLVHDDIQDESRLRRGRPTLHRLHGVPLALNAGDALAMLALRPLRDHTALGTRLQGLVLDEFLAMVEHTLSGQARELGWRRENVLDLGPDDYLELIGLKTCWYTTIYPLRVGAVIGTRGAADLDALSRFGFFLGATFQIRDDVLDLTGPAAVTGKEALGDLREGKRTLMLIHLLEHLDIDDRRWTERYLASPIGERTDGDVAHLLALMERHGSIDFAMRYGRGLAGAAHDWFAAAFRGAPPSPHRNLLELVVDYMIERDA